MTKEELIKYANDYYKDLEKVEKEACCAVDKKHKEFVRDCIKVLEQQPVTTTNNDEPMTIVYPTIFCGDAVSRQAVLDAIDNTDLDFYGDEIRDAVKNLPSVQPKRQDALSKSVIDDIRAEIAEILDYRNDLFNDIMAIIDKHIKAVEEYGNR